MISADYIGVQAPNIVLYIDNQPLLDKAMPLSTAQIILDNGNHWRKILTIFAKLCNTKDWRAYRDEKLLHTAEQICFSEQLSHSAKVHVFAGKSCWKRFAITTDQLALMSSSSCKRVYYYQGEADVWYLYTPYFDYRQFPNVLIEEINQLLSDY